MLNFNHTKVVGFLRDSTVDALLSLDVLDVEAFDSIELARDWLLAINGTILSSDFEIFSDDDRACAIGDSAIERIDIDWSNSIFLVSRIIS